VNRYNDVRGFTHTRAARPPREYVRMACDVRQGQRPWMRVVLHNISEGGFCMEWVPSIERGRPVWLRLPGLNMLQAHIRWQAAGLIGCEFSGRLYGPVLDHIVRQATRLG